MTTIHIIGIIGFLFFACFIIMCLKAWSRFPKIPWKVVTWLACIILVILALIWYWRQTARQVAGANGITNTNQITPTEEWVFIWHLPPNQYDRSRNGDTLEARIVKNDSESLWFDTIYNYDGSMEVGRTQLSKHGDRFVGSWSQDNPMDGWSIYMDKVGNQMWVGQFTDRTKRTYPCTLKRK